MDKTKKTEGKAKNVRRQRTKTRKQKASNETRDRRWLTSVPRIIDVNPPREAR